MSCGRGFRGKPPLYPPTASNLYKRLKLFKVIRYNKLAEKNMMTNIEMKTMLLLQQFCKEYHKQNSFVKVKGFMPNDEQVYSLYIRVSGIKRVEELENGNYEILFDSVFSGKLIVTKEEFEAKIMPIL